jgi:hypothetical protein
MFEDFTESTLHMLYNNGRLQIPNSLYLLLQKRAHHARRPEIRTCCRKARLPCFQAGADGFPTKEPLLASFRQTTSVAEEKQLHLHETCLDEETPSKRSRVSQSPTSQCQNPLTAPSLIEPTRHCGLRDLGRKASE